jgi:hypothetical protein
MLTSVPNNERVTSGHIGDTSSGFNSRYFHGFPYDPRTAAVIANPSPLDVASSPLDGDKLKASPWQSAVKFLEDGAKVLKARAQLRDQPAGERSMAKTVAIFNTWTGNNLSVEDGWRFMIALKQAREIQGAFHGDDYTDGAVYFSLLGEEESGNPLRKKS